MKERKPDIRFKGYEDSWIEKPFDKVFDTLSNNTLSRDKLNYDAGSIMDVHYGDVLIKFGELLDTEKEGLPFITEDADAKKLQAAFLRDGDIVVADTAEDETVGKCTEICNVGDKKILSGLHTIPCRSREEFASGFFGYYLNSGKYHDNLLPLMQGVKVTSISKSGLNETSVIYPKSKKEQALIGKFLSALDVKIKLESIVCEKIKILKAAMLGKMLPRDGNYIPEIRFSGFTEPWEQRKLGKITSKIGSGKTPLGGCKTYKERGIALIRSQNVNDNIVDLSDVVYIDTMTDESMEKSRVYYGDVLLNITGASIGRSAVYKGLEHANVNQHVCIIRLIKGYIPEFLQLNLLSDKGQKQIDSNQAGGAREGLNFQQISYMKFLFPLEEEQKRIGEYFCNLDRLIDLHQQEVEKLINIKSACMRRMFV